LHTELRAERTEYLKVFDKNTKVKYVSQLPGNKLYTHKRINVVEHLNNIALKLKSALN